MKISGSTEEHLTHQHPSGVLDTSPGCQTSAAYLAKISLLAGTFDHLYSLAACHTGPRDASPELLSGESPLVHIFTFILLLCIYMHRELVLLVAVTRTLGDFAAEVCAAKPPAPTHTRPHLNFFAGASRRALAWPLRLLYFGPFQHRKSSLGSTGGQGIKNDPLNSGR